MARRSSGARAAVDTVALAYAMRHAGYGEDVGGLARASGIRPGTLALIVTGGTPHPHPSTLLKLSQALDVEPEDLLCSVESKAQLHVR